MKLCDKISKLRKRKGLSQEKLANELDVSRQSVFKWESGENVPDIEKIKKLAKLFNVSLDLLLDDDKNILEEPLVEVKNTSSIPAHKPIKFRKVFDSNVKLNCGEQADFEHGYSGKRKIPGYSYSTNFAKHKELLNKKGFTKTIMIQDDVLVDFFLNEDNKVFGFFFDGAIQFACPFENLAAFTITNSGPHTGYTKSHMVGVGVGSFTSVSVGSMPLAQTRLPLKYDLSISYFGEDGYLHDYKISFGCNRMYITYDGTVKSVDELFLWENMLSQRTNKSLNEISSYLNGIKEAASVIRQQSANLSEIDTFALSNEVKVGQDKKHSTNTSYSNSVRNYKKKTKKGWIIALIVIAVAVGAIVTGVCVSNKIKQDQITETNRNKAQEVSDMIDNLGTITLNSESAIKAAERAYDALNSDQKKLVSNYNTLVAARSTYERLLDEKREEDTKNDPSRTIVLSDLNGEWESKYYDLWKIADISGGKSVLYWIEGKMNPTIITGSLSSSYLKGYNSKTQKMEISLYHYTILGGEYLDVTMTKSSTNVLTLYYRNTEFHKN